MEKNKPTYLEKVEIKGLWGRFDVDWDLHPDVNILVGENGSGKSTVLRKILELLFVEINVDKETGELLGVADVGGLTINNDGVIMELMSLVIGENQYQFNPGFESILSSIKCFDKNGKKKYQEISIKTDYISTFDYGLPEKNEYDRKKKPYIKTQLDKILDDIIDKYVEYQLKQTKRIIAKEKTVDEAFAKQQYFTKTLNRLFSNTEKKVNEKENRILFLLKGSTKITPYQLSSGEKQLLIILLTVLVQDEQPSILIMDEPEISLHIRWQHELIDILRKLNPNCQLIMATHSPSIFNDGHRQKVFWMEDIRSNVTKE